jgi:hypothetical protein
VLNGAEGLSNVVASLAGQGIALLDSIRTGLAQQNPDATPDDTSPGDAPSGSPDRRALRGTDPSRA